MVNRLIVFISFIQVVLFSHHLGNAQTLKEGDQINISYSNPKEYIISDVSVSGVKYLDKNVLVQLTGLRTGQKIVVPGDRITRAIKKLWGHGLFSDVRITATKIEGENIFLNIYLQERPRLNTLIFSGVKKSESEDLDEKINLVRGSQVTENIINNTKNIIKDYYIDKGFLNTQVKVVQKEDSVYKNTVNVKIYVNKHNKIKVNDIIITGNEVLSDGKIRRTMKNTKKKRWYNLFKRSKYIEEDYEEDKKSILNKYSELGYRDAKIISDSVYTYDDKTVNIELNIEEGSKYYIRNIRWVGNTKYTSEQLSKALRIRKGDVFNEEVIDKRLTMDQDAVSNLYLDDGYLFFNVMPVEVKIENDSIDLEMRIFEGKQATVDEINIIGNTKTNEHVVRRELRTVPGKLFSKTDIMRSVRELAQLGHFNPEKIVPTPVPNQAEGTVDLDYSLEERANDQVEISGGWGQNMIIGTIALTFNNFSTRNFFNKEAWRPLPTGDGQTLSLRAQATGPRYQLYSLTFVEPWLGGKKPNSLSVSLYHSLRSNGYKVGDSRRGTMKINGVSVGLGRRVSWPDDYFILNHDISLQSYELDNWPSYYFGFESGKSNNFSVSTTLSRNSLDNPLYTRRGSMFSIGLQITPPFSLFKEDNFWQLSDIEKQSLAEARIREIEKQRKYNWIEYHKWTIKADWYTPIINDLVFRARAQFGYLGYYNKNLASPFEGYFVGGDGMSGYNMYGSETVGLRGYKNNSFNQRNPDPGSAMNLYNKYTVELRYPVTLSESATIYALGFLEGGNTWMDISQFNPYNIKRSAGIGVRIFLPMLGLMGIDWGYGFDPIMGDYSNSHSQFHFVLGQQF